MNLQWLKNINKEGMAQLGMKYNRNVWNKFLWRESRSMAGDGGRMVSA